MNPLNADSLLGGLGPYAGIGIFLIVFAESAVPLGFVLHGDSLLLTAGLLCATGRLPPPTVMLAAAPGALLGAQSGYLIGRLGGRALLPPPRAGRTRRAVIRFEYLAARRGYGPALIAARFITRPRLEGEPASMSAPTQLPGFLQTLAPLLDHWGYLAVGFLLFIEDFGVPSPGETVLIAASVYAGAGRLNVVAVAVIGFAAAVLGDNLGYAIGRFGGRTLVLRFGRYLLLNEQRLDKTEAFFTRHGGKIVTVARFIEGLRQANGIIAGITRMPWRRFLAFNALGAALWVGTWTSVGYLAGNHITTIYNDANRYALYLLGAVALLVVALVIRHRRRRRRAEPSAEALAAPRGLSGSGRP